MPTCHLSHVQLFVTLWTVGTNGKEPTCQCRRHKDPGLIPGSGRSSGGGHGNPLYYSCSENPMDREQYSRIYQLLERTPEDVDAVEDTRCQPKGKVV